MVASIRRLTWLEFVTSPNLPGLFFNKLTLFLVLHQDVWLKKGIHFEGLPEKVPDTVQELSDKCFAQFGISQHVQADIYPNAYITIIWAWTHPLKLIFYRVLGIFQTTRRKRRICILELLLHMKHNHVILTRGKSLLELWVTTVIPDYTHYEK